MDLVEVHRSQKVERVKHGGKTKGAGEFEFSHTVPAVISYQDTDSYGSDGVLRNGRLVDAKIWVAATADVTYDDIYRLPDGLYYKTNGKPLPRKSGLTGSVARTMIELVRREA